ncbi:unnamed protein product [Vitrella brassicaformis CCMP3155]|uniref:SRCR domain-containing protein n=1 Tax=Vitrella brassicaformis (strain CCMP3155) TaxID=1169540 RepID=A0A0G4H272_VITBC|nr:unnamed protein product [Vitrella brassicaformis CCMP3155]|eukprot:CEM37758.1 unnamed protein product [Vitrella brassicaformis CCMP3155]
MHCGKCGSATLEQREVFEQHFSYLSAVGRCEASAEEGSPGWGFCASDGGNPVTIEVKAVSGPNLDPSSDVFLKLVGTEGTTQDIRIASEEGGTKRRVQTSAADVGPLEAVIVRSDSKDKAAHWRCKTITVFSYYRWFQFGCTDELSAASPSAEYTLSGSEPYEVTIETDGDDKAGTQGSIELSIIGQGRSTGSKHLKTGLFPGTSAHVRIRAASVGKIKAIRLTNTAADDPCFCDSLKLKRQDGSAVSFHVRRWIGTPYPTTAEVGLGEEAGGELPLMHISCRTRLNDPILIGATSSSTPNMIKVLCPSNCQADEAQFVLGSGVHPASSSICGAALHDGVMWPSGATLIVTVVKDGLPAYYKTDNPASGILAEEYVPGAGQREGEAFYVYRADSIDDIDKDVRVVDADGQLSAVGRLEVRRDGVWGSVCGVGSLGEFTEASARKACREMGYTHGLLPPRGCHDVEGEYYCAEAGYPVAMGGIHCKGDEESFLKCTFDDKPVDRCANHIFDVAVLRTNNPPAKTPAKGTLRILSAAGSPANEGRLELAFRLR